MNETELQKMIQLVASQKGMRLFRNNSGVAYDKTGRAIRYGLANESAKVNKVLKSGDLIGITPRIVTLEDVGKTVGVFTSIEVKRPGWKYKGTDREQAQLKWIHLIEQLGGIAKFASSLEEM